jgi:hypothetical protein
MRHKGEVFVPFSQIANARTYIGLGVFFTKVEEHHQLIGENR